jgi:hypothetical protein
MTAKATLPIVLQTGIHSARPAAADVGKGGLYSCTTHSLVYQTDGSSWTTWATLGGAYTSSPWSSGTSMPGSPATNQRITRTDLGLDFFYNGTRWLSTELFSESFSSPALSVFPTTTSGTLLFLPTSGIFDYWVERFVIVTQTAATNDGSNYWTVQVTRYPSATNVGGNALTNADTVNVPTRHVVTVGALTGTSDPMLLQAMVKNGSPGSLYCLSTMQYRVVGT